MEALFGLAAVAVYVLGVFALGCAAVYFIARDVETLDEDAQRERTRMDLL
jgi:hypothetical protein